MVSRRYPFLTATWSNLVLLSYEIDPAALLQYLPRAVELDTWEGKCLVTLVGLQFRDTRVLGVPIPFYLGYPQVNLRFYVRRHCNNQWRRGVVFIKQIVPQKLVALVARRAYQEKFIAMPVRHSVTDCHDAGGATRVSYQWLGSSGWNRMGVTVSGEPESSSPGSLEDFVVERYYGYSRQSDGSTLEYLLEHPRWRIQRAGNPELVCDAAGLYGPEFIESLDQPPVSAVLAEGSRVAVYKGVKIDPDQA